VRFLYVPQSTLTSSLKTLISLGFTIFFSLIFLSLKSHAVYTLGESGEVLSEGTYNMGFEPQIVINNPYGSSGLNGDFVFDYPVQADGSLRAKVGTGMSLFDASVAYKYVPFPDYLEQPAVGLKVEASSNSTNSLVTNGFRITPLTSKSFETSLGKLDPYGGLTMSLLTTGSTSTTGFQVTGGSELRTSRRSRFIVAAELNLNLSNSWSSIAGLVTYNFEQNPNTTKEP
jgi:hypothetical protein